GPDRHPQDDVIAGLAGALTARPRRAVIGKEMLLIAKINQRVQPIHRLDPDRTAVTPVTAIRPAEFDVFFLAETDTAAATGTGANINLCEIEKFHVPLLLHRLYRKGAPLLNPVFCYTSM